VNFIKKIFTNGVVAEEYADNVISWLCDRYDLILAKDFWDGNTKQESVFEMLNMEQNSDLNLMSAWWIHTAYFRMYTVRIVDSGTSEYRAEVSIEMANAYDAVELKLAAS
jgi:hypothetical protein